MGHFVFLDLECLKITSQNRKANESIGSDCIVSSVNSKSTLAERREHTTCRRKYRLGEGSQLP